jgi:predicted HNH restriction endonuclease
MHKCPRCKQDKDDGEFYYRKDGGRLTSYCKSCNTLAKREVERRIKHQCIEYLGGKCSVCGYNKNDAALDFHHKDPSQKDFSISHARSTKFETLIPELDKCILVCSNCHREIHSLHL